jgi:hypothetical protein
MNQMTQAQAMAALSPMLDKISDEFFCTRAHAWSRLPVGLFAKPKPRTTPEQRAKWREQARRRYVAVRERDNTAIQARRAKREQKRLDAIKLAEARALAKAQRKRDNELTLAKRALRALNAKRDDADPAWVNAMRVARARLLRLTPKPVSVDPQAKAELAELMLREAFKQQEAEGWYVE